MTVASLSGRLLARKGAARPSIVNAREPVPARGAVAAAPQATRADSRARISLRLDAAHHRRLRLAAVHLDCSLQDLLVSALDAYLSDLHLGCACVDTGGACDSGCLNDEPDQAS